MKKFSPPQMKEVSFPTPHTLHPTPSFQSGIIPNFKNYGLLRVCWKSLLVGAGCGVWGVGFYRFWGSQLPNFQGKSTWILPPIPPMVGTFWGQKSLKALSNKVFRFIQQALVREQPTDSVLYKTEKRYKWLTKYIRLQSHPTKKL